MKVLFHCNAISPYRNEFFNVLSKLCDLTVAYETDNSEHKHRDKRWFEGLKREYKTVKLEKKRFMGFLKGGNIVPLLKNEKFDVVILGNYLSVAGYKASKYCKKKKIKVGVSADGAIAKKEKRLAFYIKRTILKRCDFFLSPSDKTDEYFKKYKVKGKIYRYPFTSLSNLDILDFYKREQKTIATVLTVGQFIHRKGFDILIRNASRINAKIIVCGGEPTKEYLEMVNSDNIEFVGFKTKAEIGDLYKSSDVFVLPTREDIWGLVINEAMNYSLPIVTTYSCVAGVELISEGENGFLIDVTDEDALVSRINYLVDNYDLRIKMGMISNQKIKNYTIENMAKKTFEIIKEVLNG